MKTGFVYNLSFSTNDVELLQKENFRAINTLKMKRIIN